MLYFIIMMIIRMSRKITCHEQKKFTQFYDMLSRWFLKKNSEILQKKIVLKEKSMYYYHFWYIKEYSKRHRTTKRKEIKITIQLGKKGISNNRKERCHAIFHTPIALSFKTNTPTHLLNRNGIFLLLLLLLTNFYIVSSFSKSIAICSLDVSPLVFFIITLPSPSRVTQKLILI